MSADALNLEPLEFASTAERDRFLWRLYSAERFSIAELCAAFRMSRRLVADILRRERGAAMHRIRDAAGEGREVARG